jgi:eukaryotic-like serine/threonine-protein kinase
VNELVGKKLKDYAVLRRLGRGAMAEVYLAQQLSLGRQVALKVLNAELACDPTYVQRFHHEARAAAALVHGGIVQIYEVGQADGVHFIAQEYVAGRNLGEVIRSRGQLEPALALDILRQVTAALAKAASEGIVHRDIKPENIMLARSGEVKVADFGLARVQGDGGVNLTQIGISMGTPLYMSPEQIEGRELDSRSDIYSLGVTAYHMLSGAPPYVGETPLAVAVQHLNQLAPPLQVRRPDLPERVTVVVHRMLAKKPEERYADPAELLRELHAVARQGAEEGWAGGVESWSLSELIAVADDRAAATHRLEAAMRTTALAAAPRSGRISRTAWIVAACLFVGGGIGYLTRPQPLLAGAGTGPAQLESVWAQLYHAKMVDTEAAWRAVGELFPTADDFSKNLAKQGLAQCLLSRGEYEKALGPLHDLASLGSSHPSLEAFGIAGLVVAEANLNHADAARNEYGRLTAEQRALVRDRAPQLSEMLDTALGRLNGDTQ